MSHRNSRKDPVMLAAQDRLHELLQHCADKAEIARAEYLTNPRWCGVPDPCPPDHYYTRFYCNFNPWMKDGDHVYGANPRDESTAIAYHTRLIDGLIAMLKSNVRLVDPDHRRKKRYSDPSPRRELDNTRGVLRYGHRLDDLCNSMLVVPFALARCVRDRSRVWGLTPEEPRYTYVPLVEAESLLVPGIQDLSGAIKAAFDHTALSLMPRTLSDRQRAFLEWIVARGGTCRQFELIKWIDADRSRGSTSAGQGFERTLLRAFCEKDSRRGARREWVVRPEALRLLEPT